MTKVLKAENLSPATDVFCERCSYAVNEVKDTLIIGPALSPKSFHSWLVVLVVSLIGVSVYLSLSGEFIKAAGAVLVVVSGYVYIAKRKRANSISFSGTSKSISVAKLASEVVFQFVDVTHLEIVRKFSASTDERSIACDELNLALIDNSRVNVSVGDSKEIMAQGLKLASLA